MKCRVRIDSVLDERAHRGDGQPARVGDWRRGDRGRDRRAVLALDHHSHIANGLAGANHLRSGAALHIRRSGGAPPQFNRALIEAENATIAIGDAQRHRQGIDRVRIERIDREVGIHNLTFVRSTFTDGEPKFERVSPSVLATSVPGVI